MRNRADDLRIIRERVRQQHAATTQRAAREALAGEVTGTVNLEAVTDPLAAQYGLDPEHFRETAIRALQEEFDFQKGLQMVEGAVAAGRRSRRGGRLPSERIAESRSWGAPFIPGQNVQGTPYGLQAPELTALNEVFRRLLPVIEEMAGQLSRQQPSVTIHQHHGRYYSPSARERKESRTGGQFTRDALEIG